MFSSYFILHNIYVISIILLTLFGLTTINKETLFNEKNGGLSIVIWVFAIFLIIACGFRGLTGFGDTSAYVAGFNQYVSSSNFRNYEGEWLFNFIQYLFARYSDVRTFLVFVAFLYITLQLLACYKLLKGRSELLVLSCFCAFSFLTYGVNGIRNGLACSIVIFAISFIIDYKSKKDLIIATILSFCAYNIHHSSALPIAAMLFCHYYKNTKNLIYFWFLSIPISLVAGGQVMSFFSGLGFDDRMTGYFQNEVDASAYSHTGFRWDFLLYSFMPILLGYYITFKQYIQDEKYSFLLNIYIVCNAFWVMVIRTDQSNRFAYLSWFLYPIVLMYPLLSFPVFNMDNERKVALILLAHTVFTFYMGVIY